MLEFTIQSLALAVALAVVVAIMQVALGHRYRFMITISGGEARVTRGKVRADFLDDLREILSEHAIHSGWIGGVMRGKSIALRFSSNIPHACQQRLRNVWLNS